MLVNYYRIERIGRQNTGMYVQLDRQVPHCVEDVVLYELHTPQLALRAHRRQAKLSARPSLLIVTNDVIS